ncbi:MAG TPA: tRNA 2-selenouridine(34) synthase MnmH, partial [Halieaceae bacterium]|nr:tRNA 2-selenouridine(34) synthase MnmH [Halieaceae bacterium]
QRGQAAAIALGHELVAGEVRERRLAAWAAFARAHPDGYLYCFRGGLRSEIVQRWLADAGIAYPRVTGGYKALRRFLIDSLPASIAGLDIVLVCGRTGSGKTRLLPRLPRSVDLEGLARHRGSTFGRLLEPQPTQIDFENALAIALLRCAQGARRTLYVEDEGRNIGRLYLPPELRERMAAAPRIELDHPLADRVEVVLEDYVIDLGERFRAAAGDDGPAQHRDRLQGDLARARKRLGGERYQAVSAMMDEAFAAQARGDGPDGHRAWIARLLHEYYDPMYDYQAAQRDGPVLARGRREELAAWAAARDAKTGE